MALHVQSVKLGADFPCPHLRMKKNLHACVSQGSDMQLHLVSSQSLLRYSSLEFKVPCKHSFCYTRMVINQVLVMADYFFLVLSF
jgi:hypothetical protein